jgi:Ca2+:H+ antiporter
MFFLPTVSRLEIRLPCRFIVTLGWILGKPLTMLFDPFESIALFLAGVSYALYAERISPLMVVITVNYVVQDGKSNWLEGMILMCRCWPF